MQRAGVREQDAEVLPTNEWKVDDEISEEKEARYGARRRSGMRKSKQPRFSYSDPYVDDEYHAMAGGHKDVAHTSTRPGNIDYCSTSDHQQRTRAPTITNRKRTEAKLTTPAPAPSCHGD